MKEVSESRGQMHAVEEIKNKVGKEVLSEYEMLLLACESIVHTYSYNERNESNNQSPKTFGG